MIDFGDVYHLGINVPDVPAAMRELTASMGLHWGQQHHIEMTTWVPGQGYQDVALNIVYSIEEPVHIELIQATPAGVWNPALGTGLHHIGLFAEDVGDVTAKLVSTGWAVERACLSPEERYGDWTHVRSPSGLVIEPVSTESRERFARYWAGGSLV